MYQSASASLPLSNPYNVRLSDRVGAPSDVLATRLQTVFGSFRPVSVNPNPSIEECLYEARAGFKLRTAAVAMHLSIEDRDRLFAQLDSLLDSEEWEQADPVPEMESFNTLLRLLFQMKEMSKRPSLGLSDNGALVAVWVMDEGTITVECYAKDVLRWSVVRRGGADPTESAAGSSILRRIGAVLAPYHITSWTRSIQNRNHAK